MIRAIHKPLKVQAVRLTKEIASVPDSSPFKVFGVKDRARDLNEPAFWRLPENQTLPGRFYIRQNGETQVVNIGDWLVKYEGSTTVEVLTSGEFHRRFRQIRDDDKEKQDDLPPTVQLTMGTYPWPWGTGSTIDIIARADETLSSAIHAQIHEQQRIEARKLDEKILGTVKDFIESEKPSATGALIRERKAENMIRKYLKGELTNENRGSSRDIDAARKLDEQMRANMPWVTDITSDKLGGRTLFTNKVRELLEGRQSDENRDPSSDNNAGKTDPRCFGPCVNGGSQCSGNGSCGHHD